MFVLIKVDIDHEEESEAEFLGAFESHKDAYEAMLSGWHDEMESASPKWVDKWNDEYSYVNDMYATAQDEEIDFAVHWWIIDTSIDPRHCKQLFTFI